MLNFTVGPVALSNSIKELRKQDIPYFRTEEFSKIMFENEFLIKKFFDLDSGKVIFLTGSSTMAMDASILNLFDTNDKLLVVNGGSFGQRFVDICKTYHIPCDEIKLELGTTLTKDVLEEFENKNYTALLVQGCETSTGVKYDLKMLGDFCERNNLLFVVDAVSAFLADKISMKEMHIDVMLTGSQKALAISPGLSIVALRDSALEKLEKQPIKSYYMDFKTHLKNMERGQTPFTPAVGILLELNERLKNIDLISIEKENQIIAERATYFRKLIKELDFDIFGESLSNCVTAVCSNNAYEIFIKLKDEYNIYICPNGGELKNKIFRVGHIGELELSDYDKLIFALKDLKSKGY